jgi:enoyl-CoA hydratase/carnithine racemase
MRRGFDTDLDAGLRIEDEMWAATAFSGDRAEGVAAFNEKRRPRWPGR